MGDRTSVASQQRIKKMLLPSELQKIPDLEAYIKMSGYDWTRVKLNYKSYPQVTEPLILKKEV